MSYILSYLSFDGVCIIWNDELFNEKVYMPIDKIVKIHGAVGNASAIIHLIGGSEVKIRQEIGKVYQFYADCIKSKGSESLNNAIKAQ